MRIPFVDTRRKNKEARSLIENAQHKYDSAQKRMDRQRQATSKRLETLGAIKLDMWSNDIGEFLDVYRFFKEVKIEGKIIGKEMMKIPVKPDWNINEMQKVSMNATEVVQGGLASLSAGALAGVASYGAVSMLGTASTGTAISTLSGAAAHSATLAWFGGGAVSAGGAGIGGGILALGGIVMVPVLLVADSILYAKADEKLAKARQIYQEAKLAAEKMNTVTDFMLHAENLSDGYIAFLQEFRKIYGSLLHEVKKLAAEIQNGTVGGSKASFDRLSLPQKKLLQITWLMTQILYHVLKAPLLTKRGNIHRNAELTLSAAREAAGELTAAYRMGNEVSEATVGKIANIGKKETLSQKIQSFFSDALPRVGGSGKFASKISGWNQNFLHSGTLGYVSLAMFILSVTGFLSFMVVRGLLWLFACYAAYPGVALNAKPNVRIAAAMIVFVIGLIL